MHHHAGSAGRWRHGISDEEGEQPNSDISRNSSSSRRFANHPDDPNSDVIDIVRIHDGENKRASTVILSPRASLDRNNAILTYNLLPPPSQPHDPSLDPTRANLDPHPPIRRIIAQQGAQIRVEYYPQWVPRVWLESPTSPDIDKLKEWRDLQSKNEEHVLTYTPLASIHDPPPPLSQAHCGNADETATTMAPWKVLRSSVPNDNDSPAHLAAMLSATLHLAVAELQSLTLHHVLSSPVVFTPNSGSKRRAAELMGRSGLDIDISAFLAHLVTLSPRERRKFEPVKVRWMGQVDPRVGVTTGRTHSVSAVAYVAPVCEGWEGPLGGVEMSRYMRDMMRGCVCVPTPSASSDTKDTGYTALLTHRAQLFALLSASPYLLSPTSHLTALVWTLLPRRQLKSLYGKLGICVPPDWHNYQREMYTCRYSEVVRDQRSWHDIMETSLFLNRHFKELRIVEEGERDEWETEDEGDTEDEEEDGEGEQEKEGLTVVERLCTRGLKREACEMQDGDVTDREGNAEDEDDDDGGDDDEYEAPVEVHSDTDSNPDVKIIERPSRGPPASRSRLSIKSASSKAPRKAQIIDPDAKPRRKKARTKGGKGGGGGVGVADELTAEEWRVIRALRVKKDSF
ncbi:hypothetical protein NX059_004406 [Plenodomus lindquistii]|nr:hypothetical protein NX059_004406 [Plenodomus lindquistii]